MLACNALIHEFHPELPPCFDEDGDQMIGYYWQFVDEDENPVTNLIGPYRYRGAAERAAKVAFSRKDF